MHARWTCVLRETYVPTRRYLKTFLTPLASIDFNPKQPRQLAIPGFVVCPHASFGVPQLCKKDAARWKGTRDGMRLSKAEHLGL